MNLSYNAKIKKEGHSYLVHFVSMPDVFSYGDNLQEALFNAKDVLNLMLEQKLDENVDFPKPDRAKKGLHPIHPKLNLQVALMIKFSDKSISQIARDMNTSWANVQKLMKRKSNPTLKQVDKLSSCLGFDLFFSQEK